VDCGLFQERAFLERNWLPFPVPPESLDYVLLTHIHLDHCGLLPKLVREGFAGEILTTAASADLLPLVLLDSARVQEEDAAYKKKRHQKEGRRGPHPEIPLYTEAEASRVSNYLHPVSYQTEIELQRNITVRFHEAGHILGSAMIELCLRNRGRTLRILFSGDIGQRNKPLVRDPAVFEQADAVIMESTYGERNHQDPADIETLMTAFIKETARAGGNVVIPVFAVERAQELLFHLSRLVRKKLIPRLPVFLDSPLAGDVTEVFLRHPECFDRETLGLFRSGQSPFEFAGLKITRTADESRAINSLRQPAVIMAGAGMCTGGRIKHHLRHNISRPESTILFVGYQAAGTLGRQIQEGRPEVRIFGELHPLRARIREIRAFSGHADRDGLLAWVGHFRRPRPRLFLTHGEREVAESLAGTLREDRGFIVSVPGFRDSWEAESENLT
jgi:metallo-beta-lactamase family protein